MSIDINKASIQDLEKHAHRVSKFNDQKTVKAVFVENDATDAIPVTVISTIESTGDFISQKNEINALAKNASADIITYTVPMGNTYRLTSAAISGDSIAVFKVFFDNVREETKRLLVTKLNEKFDLRGYTIEGGSTIRIEVFNASNQPATYETTLRGYLE